MISDESAKELQKIIKEDYGKDITIEEAKEYGESYVRYFELLIKIYNENKEEINKKDKERTDES